MDATPCRQVNALVWSVHLAMILCRLAVLGACSNHFFFFKWAANLSWCTSFVGVVYLYICSFPWTENHSLPKSFLVRVDYRLGILFFLLLLFTFELGSRTSQSNTRSFQMSYRNSVSQNEMRNLTRDVQTTSVSCSEKDVTRSYFDQSAKDSSNHANRAKVNTKHSLHRCIFKKPYHSKKVAEEQRKTLNTQLRQKFVSPSDSLLSPLSLIHI